jgi:hypothetical protein
LPARQLVDGGERDAFFEAIVAVGRPSYNPALCVSQPGGKGGASE